MAHHPEHPHSIPSNQWFQNCPKLSKTVQINHLSTELKSRNHGKHLKKISTDYIFYFVHGWHHRETRVILWWLSFFGKLVFFILFWFLQIRPKLSKTVRIMSNDTKWPRIGAQYHSAALATRGNRVIPHNRGPAPLMLQCSHPAWVRWNRGVLRSLPAAEWHKSPDTPKLSKTVQNCPNRPFEPRAESMIS